VVSTVPAGTPVLVGPGQPAGAGADVDVDVGVGVTVGLGVGVEVAVGLMLAVVVVHSHPFVRLRGELSGSGAKGARPERSGFTPRHRRSGASEGSPTPALAFGKGAPHGGQDSACPFGAAGQVKPAHLAITNIDLEQLIMAWGE
jgi:hypothetical protein